jgi:mannose-6-phosphate isomerase-like protein (cupin superfamily)
VFYLDDGVEKTIDLAPGVVVLAPKDIWHKVVNTQNKPLIASQATKQPAGLIWREEKNE